MDYQTSFALLLINLIESIQNNDLSKTEENINSIINWEQDNPGFKSLTSGDIISLKAENDSFRYLIYNYTSLDKDVLETLWNLKSHDLMDRFNNKIISGQDIEDFIYAEYEDKNSLIKNYKYLNLIRLAMLIEDYEFIQKIKLNLRGE